MAVNWLLLIAAVLLFAFIDGMHAKPQPQVCQCQNEEYSDAIAQASDVGRVVGDRRRLSDAEILAILSAQFLDSNRNQTFDSALFEEVQRVQQRIARQCEFSELQVTRGL